MTVNVQIDGQKTAAPKVGQRRLDGRRKHKRRYLSLPVRFMAAGSAELKGVLRDISAGGVCIEADILPKLDETLIIYIDSVGRFEGRVIRCDEESFAVQMLLSTTKKQRLKSSLDTFFQKRKPKPLISDRRHNLDDRRSQDRLSGDLTTKIFGKTKQGVTFECAIKIMSLSGIDIQTEAQLEIGEYVSIGKIYGYVARKNDDGYVILIS